MILVVAATTMAQELATMATLLLPSIAPEMARVLQADPSLIGYQVSIVYGGGDVKHRFRRELGSAFRRLPHHSSSDGVVRHRDRVWRDT